MRTDKYIKFAIFFALTAVILGAMRAYALKELLSTEQLSSFQTGIRYQMFHAISILILALNIEKFNTKIKRSLHLIVAGVFCFSFSIYLLSIQEILGVNLGF